VRLNFHVRHFPLTYRLISEPVNRLLGGYNRIG